MYEHPAYGVVIPEKSWVPAPRYLLRRDRILRWLKTQPKGSVLEIGPGSGALLKDMAKMGWDCVGLDVSKNALDLTNYVTESCGNVELYANKDDLEGRQFDLVIACEVLEHIEGDQQMFNEWSDFLRSGGCLLLSMPAHMKRWDETDVWAGHYRRYEYDDLVALSQNNSMEIGKIECYGFPLALLTTAVRVSYLSKKGRAERKNPGDKQEKTEQSGVNRGFEMRYFGIQKSWLGVLAMRFGMWLQHLFVKKPYGNGYLLWALKK
ncbi:MAG TPA: class I SAM-dependent methyltransferase [Opitutae bacterium]|nr:class I SAM-dependent methyltransferase [Opitutae bacterium]